MGEEFACPVDSWSSQIVSVTYDNWQKECIDEPQHSSKLNTLFTVVVLMCVAFVLVVCLVIFAVYGFFKEDSKEGTGGQISIDISSNLINFNTAPTKEEFALDQDDAMASNVKRF